MRAHSALCARAAPVRSPFLPSVVLLPPLRSALVITIIIVRVRAPLRRVVRACRPSSAAPLVRPMIRYAKRRSRGPSLPLSLFPMVAVPIHTWIQSWPICLFRSLVNLPFLRRATAHIEEVPSIFETRLLQK